MTNLLKNIIVVGGSFVGRTTAQELARVLPDTHRVLLIEPHSHFHHLFTFPRFAIVPGQEHKAFIPYNKIYHAAPNASSHTVVQARVLSIQQQHVKLDREWQGSNQIPFEYLTVATGTRLAEPAGMRDDDKPSSVAYLQKHQDAVKRANSILIVGGGAVSVQMATDLKEVSPEKEVTVVQSREHVMPQFHGNLHNLVKKRFDELGVRLVTGSRVTVPENGFPNDGSTFNVQLTNGTQVPTQFVILATGQTPNNDLVGDLAPSTSETIVNPDNGFIRVKKTMQFVDPKYSNLFAVGDIADTGARKAAKPGSAQAAVVAKNILNLIEGKAADEQYEKTPPAIHITLGMVSQSHMRNPERLMLI
ncbi:hypothetical protein AWENTII_009754 [Aspergillus wentii]